MFLRKHIAKIVIFLGNRTKKSEKVNKNSINDADFDNIIDESHDGLTFFALQLSFLFCCIPTVVESIEQLETAQL